MPATLDRRRVGERARAMFAASVGSPSTSARIDDRRRLAGREVGLERDGGVAALEAGRAGRPRPACPARGAGTACRRGAGSARAGIRTTTGRRITPWATPLPARRRVRRRRRRRRAARTPPDPVEQAARLSALTRGPSMPRTAGRNVRAKNTERRDDERAADPDRAQRGRLEQEQPGQADRDREPGERDGLAARRDGSSRPPRRRSGPGAAPRGTG